MLVFVAVCGKKNSNALFGSFWKKILQSVTNKESFTNFKIIVTKCDKKLLQRMTVSETEFIAKRDRCCKVWQEVITKCDRYYKVWQ